ncbi:glycogen synthase GlgA [Dyella nitratireducens]|uniref:glycogen synthase GlgA n=1 Tax=Dyella nitratireducens TaxID=1849580 RepID=UPI00166983A5|nr:glycogen synthase GlgA [Dyella nitratireducens]
MTIPKPVHRTSHLHRHQQREAGTYRRRSELPATEARTDHNGGRVLFVTTEMTDFVKAGGLGDVSAALPRAVARHHDVRVLIPGYPNVLAVVGKSMRMVGKTRGYHKLPACQIAEATLSDGLGVLVLCNADLYEREGSPYADASGHGWADNDIRFATLSYAAAEIALKHAHMSWQPDLLHLNDWPCALATHYLDGESEAVPTVLTIHNLAYQGVFPASAAAHIGLSARRRIDHDRHGRISFLHEGIAKATYLSTVSECYAKQITEPPCGCGLDVLLRKRASEGRLTGIVNGIDHSWDPQHDPALRIPFAIGEWDKRHENTQQLRDELGLRQQDGPLFAVISRMVQQKGVDLIYEAAPQIIAAGGQLALIGRGDPAIEHSIARLPRRFPGRVVAHIGFEEGLARRMFAGADFLLMPSRYEPCGLSQMYAQAYGCLPVAHATGGLIDTIEDGITGLLFRDATVSELRRCLQRAFRVFAEPLLLNAMRGAAMLEKHGWDVPGRQYATLYSRILLKRPSDPSAQSAPPVREKDVYAHL